MMRGPYAGKEKGAQRVVVTLRNKIKYVFNRPNCSEFQETQMLNSIICRYDAFATPWFKEHATFIKPNWADNPPHRKLWEWCAITQALYERYMLQRGRSGVGFAVGKEPLPSLFARYGANIIATDLASSGGSNNFEVTGVWAGRLADCHRANLIDKETFERKVRFQPADMKDLSCFESESADFVWSSCAIEHLGSLEAGLNYVLESTRLLKPGGVSVHTTEFNIGSETGTIEAGPDVIYRRRDLEELSASLRRMKCFLAPLTLEPGHHKYDLDYATPPYNQGGQPHISLLLKGHICTSVLLIIQKGGK